MPNAKAPPWIHTMTGSPAPGSGSGEKTLIVSQSIRLGARSAALFNHYSLLRTTEQLLCITTFLVHAGDAGTRSMRATSVSHAAGSPGRAALAAGGGAPRCWPTKSGPPKGSRPVSI